MTARNFCLTVQVEFTDAKEHHDALNPDEWDGCRYFVWQLEQANTGQLHYQCFLQYDRCVRFSAIKKLVGLEGAHIEPMRGTAEQARDYCMKADSRVDGPWEWGTFVTKGSRSDIASAVAMVKEGKSDLEIVEAMPATFIRYFRGLEKVRMLHAPKRNWKTRVYFLFGEPGMGKSHFARELLPEAHWKQPSTRWWDEYCGGDVVIDEFKGWMPYSDLLRVMDQYPVKVETKGGQAEFGARHMVITSNVIPQKWYNPETVKFNWVEFSRRVDVWLHCPRFGVVEEISAAKFYELYVFSV